MEGLGVISPDSHFAINRSGRQPFLADKERMQRKGRQETCQFLLVLLKLPVHSGSFGAAGQQLCQLLAQVLHRSCDGVEAILVGNDDKAGIWW